MLRVLSPNQCSAPKMASPKLHVLFCLCCCLALAHPFSWQDLSPFESNKSSAWLQKMQTLMSSPELGRSGIPKGNGSYPVGCTDLMFDYANESTFLRLYYPSQGPDRLDTVWIPHKEYFWGVAKFLGTLRIWGNILNLLYGSTTVSANWNSPLKTGEKYPLIIFSHGLGAFRTIYSAIGLDLASHGFIVAAVEHRDGSASATYYFEDQLAAEKKSKSWFYLKTLKREEAERVRKEQVQQRAKECSRALSALLDLDLGKSKRNVLGLEFDVGQLKGSVDRTRVAVMGHSFGGATVVQALSTDRRFRCGVALDAWMLPVRDEVYASVSKPLFFINSASFQSLEAINKMKKYWQPDKRKMITIKGSVHQNFDDFTFVTGDVIGRMLTLKGDIDSTVAIDLSNKASLAFLQKHLGLHKDFDQWDPLVEGDNENLIPGSSYDVVTHPPAVQNSTGLQRQKQKTL